MHTLAQLRDAQAKLAKMTLLNNGSLNAVQQMVGTLMDFAGDLGQCKSQVEVAELFAQHQYTLVRRYVEMDIDMQSGDILVDVRSVRMGEYEVCGCDNNDQVIAAIGRLVYDLRG